MITIIEAVIFRICDGKWTIQGYPADAPEPEETCKAGWKLEDDICVSGSTHMIPGGCVYTNIKVWSCLNEGKVRTTRSAIWLEGCCINFR